MTATEAKQLPPMLQALDKPHMVPQCKTSAASVHVIQIWHNMSVSWQSQPYDGTNTSIETVAMVLW